ncbi:MAG: PstS family phosphate ABC transporter substrate-binding protein [Phycisphaeraceae bacterium]
MKLATIVKSTLATAVAASAVTLSATSASAQAGSTTLRGSIQIDGSSTVYPVSEAVASGFRDLFPNVKVTVGVSGTGGGFKRFTRGETAVSDASRPIKWKEFEAASENGVSFVEVPVALDGLSIVVNPANDWADQFSVDQLKQIFLEDGAKRWSDVDPSWPDLPIRIYAPGTESGTFDYFKEVVAGKTGNLRPDMSTSEDDNVLVTGVAGEKNAIGFFGAAYYFNNKAKLKAVPVVNPDTGEAVMPTPDNVESGAYAPFGRPLFIYVNAEMMRRPEVRTFVRYYLRQAPEVATRVDYVPLPKEMYQRAAEHIGRGLTGTHFWKAGGEEREGSLQDVYTAENLLETPR